MGTAGGREVRRGHVLAIEIEPIPLAMRRPSFLESVCLLGGGDAESIKRQDQGAHTDVRFSAFANMPTLRTPENWRMDVSLGSNSLQHRVQVIAQFDDSVEGHTLMPLGAQPIEHFQKPYSLRVTSGHV